MCGIIGIVGNSDVAERLVDGLRRMEYRGYDSAGVCTIFDDALIRRRAPGKLFNLVTELARHPAPGHTGIAHTRWATHGAPTAANAHPHATGELALVHNGIIENFKPLREALTKGAASSRATPIPKWSRISSPNWSRPAPSRPKRYAKCCRNCAARSRWRSRFGVTRIC